MYNELTEEQANELEVFGWYAMAGKVLERMERGTIVDQQSRFINRVRLSKGD